MKTGKLIVIDGSDGTGKATQVKLLIKRLEKSGCKVKTESFPQYGKKSAGPVEDYLSGLYGTSESLGAYIPSIFYAVDRFAAAERIRRHLKEGYVVISNRYVTSNLAHQGSKIRNSVQRTKFFKWLLDLEYGLFKLPKPDLEIILHVPYQVSTQLLKQRGPTFYIGSRHRDIHEKDLNFLKESELLFRQVAKKFNYKSLECYVDGKLLSIQEINDKIYQIVKRYLNG